MKKIVKEAMTIFGVVVFISGFFSAFQAQGQSKPIQTKSTPKAKSLTDVNLNPGIKKPLIDLIPVGDPNNPESYCVLNSQGKLIIRIKNQYDGKPPASTTKVEFDGNAPILLATPAIFGRSTGRGTVSLPPIDVPLNCFHPYCHFTITADANNQVSELNEDNNHAACVCRGKGIDLVPVNPHPELGEQGFCSGSLVLITIKNKGDADATKSKLLLIFNRVGSSNFKVQQELYVPAIPRGGSVDVKTQKPSQWSGYQVQFKIFVDHGNQIVEYDEGNNTGLGLCK